MLETWLIILTALPPFVEPMLQELPAPSCYEKVEEWRAQPTTIWARCEARRKPEVIK